MGISNFFLILISVVLLAEAEVFGQTVDCGLSLITKKICVSSAIDSQLPTSFPCENLASHGGIVSQIQAAYKLSPVWFRKQLCRVAQIQVRSTLKAGNFSSWAYDEPGIPRVIGLDKNRLDKVYKLSDLFWFIGGVYRLGGLAKVPKCYGHLCSPDVYGAATLYSIAHELGHHMYAPNDKYFRQAFFGTCKTYKTGCAPFFSGNFGFIDWFDGNGKDEEVYGGREHLENIGLRNFINPLNRTPVTIAQIDRFHWALLNSSFVSPFALSSPNEDFSELYALRVLSESIRSWPFRFSNGQYFDILERIRNPNNQKLRVKFKFLDQRINEFGSLKYW